MKDIRERLDVLFIKSIRDSAVEKDLREFIKEIEENFKENLNPKEQVFLADYTDAFNQLISLCIAEYFKRGFWTGCGISCNLQEM